jgi:hypothetical protein
VEERDVTIVMETLFDIRNAVYEIHDALLEEDEGDDEEEAEDDG